MTVMLVSCERLQSMVYLVNIFRLLLPFSKVMLIA